MGDGLVRVHTVQDQQVEVLQDEEMVKMNDARHLLLCR
jgi:hypothetical protein